MSSQDDEQELTEELIEEIARYILLVAGASTPTQEQITKACSLVRDNPDMFNEDKLLEFNYENCGDWEAKRFYAHIQSLLKVRKDMRLKKRMKWVEERLKEDVHQLFGHNKRQTFLGWGLLIASILFIAGTTGSKFNTDDSVTIFTALNSAEHVLLNVGIIAMITGIVCISPIVGCRYFLLWFGFFYVGLYLQFQFTWYKIMACILLIFAVVSRIALFLQKGKYDEDYRKFPWCIFLFFFEVVWPLMRIGENHLHGKTAADSS